MQTQLTHLCAAAAAAAGAAAAAAAAGRESRPPVAKRRVGASGRRRRDQPLVHLVGGTQRRQRGLGVITTADGLLGVGRACVRVYGCVFLLPTNTVCVWERVRAVYGAHPKPLHTQPAVSPCASTVRTPTGPPAHPLTVNGCCCSSSPPPPPPTPPPLPPPPPSPSPLMSVAVSVGSARQSSRSGLTAPASVATFQAWRRGACERGVEGIARGKVMRGRT